MVAGDDARSGLLVEILMGFIILSLKSGISSTKLKILASLIPNLKKVILANLR